MRSLTKSVIRVVLPLLVGLGACSSDVPTSSYDVRNSASVGMFPDVTSLPDGFAPEGIAFGSGPTFYVASLATGAIYRGDARTGEGSVLVPATPGRSACGVKYDPRTDRLFVAGSVTGQAYVYDASTGATIAVYQLSDPTTGPTAINDVVVLQDAVYFTDNSRPVIYRLPLGPNDALPPAGAVQTIPLTGDFQFIPGGINGNGIVATPDNRHLIVGNTFGGALYLVDPLTGRATTIGVDGNVQSPDGLLLVGHTLYMVQGRFNRIAVVQMNADFTSGTVERTLTNAALAFPSSIGLFGGSLYAVNARFNVPRGPSVEYDVVRVQR